MKLVGLALVLLLMGTNLFAYTNNLTTSRPVTRLPMPSEFSTFKIDNASLTGTKINYDNERVVVSATLVNDNSSSAFSYSGTFSPAVTAYIKPFTRSRLKTFVQASCIDYDCNQIILSIGFRSKAENPNAYVEPKFVLSRIRDI
jgi:hypothetical protein